MVQITIMRELEDGFSLKHKISPLLIKDNTKKKTIFHHKIMLILLDMA